MNHLYDNPRTGPVDRLAEVVEKALREEVARIVETESAIAAQEVHRQIRDKVGAIATRVCNRIHLERHAQELIIRVDFSESGNKSSIRTTTT
jgi:hypothetical protein